MKICGCIAEKEQAAIDEGLKNEAADLFEIRLDYLEDYKKDLAIITELPKKTEKDIIATLRPTCLGGYFEGSENERAEVLKNCIDSEYTYVDVELESEIKEEIIDYAEGKKTKIIVSTHDFEKTTNIDDLKKVLDQIIELGADIGKIVTMPNSIDDCHNVLEIILYGKKKNFNVVAFCMGKIGKFTRVSSLLYGSPFSYASLNQATAEGQMSAENMKKIIREFK